MQNFYYNLAGGLNTAATKTDLGLDTRKVFWSEAKNVEIFKNKGVIRQNGNETAFVSPENKPIAGIFGYEIDSKEYILYNCEPGELYCRDMANNTDTLVKTGITYPHNVTYTRYLTGVVVSNGVDDPFYFDHKKPTEPKPCNAKAANGINIRSNVVASYKGRLWIAMGGSLYFSALGRYDDWSSVSDAGYISNFLSDIDKITAIQGYKDYLAIYKRDNTFLLSGSSPSDFAIQKFADKGALNPLMAANICNKQYFCDGTSVFTLEQAGILAQIALGSELSLNVKPEFQLYNYSSVHLGRMLHYEKKNQLWIFYPTISNVKLGTVLIYDYVNDAWTMRQTPQPISCAMVMNNKIYSATSDGRVLLEDYGHTFDGEAIDFRWKSPFFSLGEPNKRKCVEDFYFLLDDNFDNNFKFTTYKNYDTIIEDDIVEIITRDAQFLVWDSDIFVWADDNQGNIWTNVTEGVYKTDITQSNYSVQLAIEGSDVSQNFALIGLEFKEVYYD